MYQIYLYTFKFFVVDKFKSLEEAEEHANKSGFEYAIYQDDALVKG